MKIITTIAKDIRQSMKADLRILRRGIVAGTKETGNALKFSLRKQVRNAGMSRRFSKSWRSKHYPNDGFNAATLVWSKAPEIIRSFNEGLIIKANEREWLAIPTKFAPKKFGRFRATPERLMKASRVKFRFVQTGENNALLIAKSTRRKRPVVWFVLVKQVKMPKEFDVESAAVRWAGKMPSVIEREVRKEIMRARR